MDSRRQSLHRLLEQFTLGGQRSLLHMDYGTDVLPSPVRDPRETTRQMEEPVVHWMPLVSSPTKLSDPKVDHTTRDGRMEKELLQTSRKIVGMFEGLS